MSDFYKLAKPDGFDFYTGKTINYRENIGRRVVCPDYDRNGDLCSSAFIHASREPNRCFVGSSIPCSAYLVIGRPIKESSEKCGFRSLKIVKELKPEELFKWNYREAANPTNPLKIIPPKITDEHIDLLKRWASVWASVWDSVRDSVGDSVGDPVGDSVRDSVWGSFRDSVWDSFRDSVWDSVGDPVWAYMGWIFKDCIKTWKYIKHIKGEYPFQPAVDLWFMGLVSSFDGKKWRLHGGKDAKVLWEGKI